MLNIIGAGRVGTALKLASPSKVELFDRSRSLDEIQIDANDDLIMLSCRNDSLAKLIEDLSVKAQKKIVLIQNGMLSPFIRDLEYPLAARAILYFAVSKKGELPKPGGDTLITGSKADTLKEYFDVMNIPSKIVSQRELARVEMEKLLWNSIMGLLGDYYQESVGDSVKKHWDDVDKILQELLPVIENETTMSWDKKDLSESLKNYSEEVSHFNARIKEWEWRNAWFFDALENQNMKAPHWEKLHNEISK